MQSTKSSYLLQPPRPSRPSQLSQLRPGSLLYRLRAPAASVLQPLASTGAAKSFLENSAARPLCVKGILSTILRHTGQYLYEGFTDILPNLIFVTMLLIMLLIAAYRAKSQEVKVGVKVQESHRHITSKSPATRGPHLSAGGAEQVKVKVGKS